MDPQNTDSVIRVTLSERKCHCRHLRESIFTGYLPMMDLGEVTVFVCDIQYETANLGSEKVGQYVLSSLTEHVLNMVILHLHIHYQSQRQGGNISEDPGVWVGKGGGRVG